MSKVFIQEETLSAIGSAIREKTGKSDLIAPGAMPAEILGIVSGGGEDPTAEELTLTGNMEYAFAHGRFDWLINKYGHLITTENIENPEGMFASTQVEEIPFSLNFKKDIDYAENAHCRNLFSNSYLLKSLPAMNNFKPYSLNLMFSGCNHLREIPEEVFDSWDWSFIDGASAASVGSMSNIFNNCYSLRKIPMTPFYHGNTSTKSATYHIYNYLCNNCAVLDEITNIPAPKNAQITITSNMFNGALGQCNRLKEFTFTPGITLNWSNQTIDLTQCCGYSNYTSYVITDYNSGITADKEVRDDATYQALKNDPDWYSIDPAYSRYNHTSAVNTINSLPTVNSGTIKFKGEAGSNTDGGAINTLTEEEIAVAAAKGWTVSLT